MNNEEVIDWIPAGQGIDLLAAENRNTFFYYVRVGKIRKHLGERERDTLYNREDILMVKKTRMLKKKKIHTIGATDWVRPSDLAHLLELDYKLYGEYTVEASVTQHWWKKNPTACRILFNEHNRKDIWGAISAIPMKEETILQLLTGNMQEKDITADDILTYEDGGEYTIYIASAAIDPNHLSSLPKLLNSVLTFWCEQYPHIHPKKLYAFASSNDGLRFIKYLFFSPRYDLGKHSYELDPFEANPSPFIKRFQQCIMDKAVL